MLEVGYTVKPSRTTLMDLEKVQRQLAEKNVKPPNVGNPVDLLTKLGEQEKETSVEKYRAAFKMSAEAKRRQKWR